MNIPKDAKSEFNKWHSNTKLVFLNSLLERILQVSDQTYDSLRDTLQLSSGQNAEVVNLWIQIGLLKKKTDIISTAVTFLSQYGRMKYIRPIYIAFYLFDKNQALDTFNKYRSIYHPIAVNLILQDFAKIGVIQQKFLS